MRTRETTVRQKFARRSARRDKNSTRQKKKARESTKRGCQSPTRASERAEIRLWTNRVINTYRPAANTVADARVTHAGTRVCYPTKRESSSPTGGQRERYFIPRCLPFASRSRTRLSGRRFPRVAGPPEGGRG